MSRVVAAAVASILTLALALVADTGRAQDPPGTGSASPGSSAATPADSRVNVQKVIERHLRRPYVWGSSGLKSFDCSGFVWRVMHENGVHIKRTTARKYYMTLPKVPADDRWSFGNIVFFSDLKHCGIVDTRETFYHAAVTAGTHRSRFDPHWRPKVSGIRAMPGLTIRRAASARPDSSLGQ